MATTDAMTTGIMFFRTCPGYCTAMHAKLVPHLAVPYAAPIAAWHEDERVKSSGWVGVSDIEWVGVSE
jgi:hypothetical protein